MVIFDETIGWKIRNCRAEIIIETTGDRSVLYGLCIINVVALAPCFRRLAVFTRPIPAQMPLTDTGGVVSVVLQQFGYG